MKFTFQKTATGPSFGLALRLALALSLLLASLSLAQTAETGAVSGRVMDRDGAPMADVVVTGAQADGSNGRTVVTDAEGRFRLALLPPGTYGISVQAMDTVHEAAELRVSAGQTRELDVTLDVTRVADDITVTATAPLIDASTTEYSTTLSAEDLELLPTAREADDLVKFTPGARPDQVWGGSTSQANSYQLDGVGVNHPGFGGDFLLPNVDWIEEIEVKGLGAGAQYGSFQGGLINIVTKSGGNELKGAVRSNFESDGLNSSNLVAGEAGSERDERWELSADLSGPLVQDRLYYFVSAQQADTTTRIVDAGVADSVAFLPVEEERTETKLFGKLTWEPTQSDRLAFVLGADDVETENRGLDSFTAPEAGQTQDSPSMLYSAAWQRVVGGSGIVELKLSGFDASDDRLPQNGDRPAVQILGGDRELFGNAVYTRTRDLENTAVSASWDGFFDLGSTRHSLKIGFEADQGTWLETRRRNGGFTWRPEEGSGVFDPNDPSTWGFISSDWGGDIRLDAETRNQALYVQDDISVGDRLTLSLGVRYADWQGDITPGFSGGPSFEAIDADGLAPRVGLTWDAAGDGRWVVKAHFGRYYQSLFALMFDRAEGTDAFRNTEFWDWDLRADPDLGQAYNLGNREDFFFFFDDIPTGEQVGPVIDYDQPYVDQIVLGLETALDSKSRLGFTYIHRENEDILALVDRNLASNYTLFRGVRVIDFRSGDPVLGADGNPLVLGEMYVSNDDILFVGGAPGLDPSQVDGLTYDPDLVLTNADGAGREMDQVQVTYDRRAEGWNLAASLVWTDLVGNFFSVSGYDDAFGTGAGSFVEPNLGLNAQGALPNAAEWEFKLRLSGDLPWGLRGGLYLLWATGDTYTPSYTLDRRNHDFIAADGSFFDPDHIFGVNGQAIFLEPRGNRERDNFSTLDVFLEKHVPVGDAGLYFGLDVFNLLNEDAATGLVTTVGQQDPGDPSTLFGAVRSRQTPRTVRLNATLRF